MSTSADKKKKINWKRTFKNNAYMLKFIAGACPGLIVFGLVSNILGAVHSFLLDTYMFQYAINALHEGKELKIVIALLVCIFIYSLIYLTLDQIYYYYYEIKEPRVEAYIKNELQKKAAEADLACFENPEFYDTYVKAVDEAAERAYTVMNNIFDVIWVFIKVGLTVGLIITIEPLFMIFAFLPVICTMLVGKKRNRIKYDNNMKTKELARQRDYVRRTFYLKDFSKEMRLTEMHKVMFKRMHDSIAEMKAVVDEYGYKIMFFMYLFDFIFDVVVYTGAIILAAYKTLVAKNMLLGDCFVVINSISSVAGNLNYVGDTIFRLDENSLYVDNLRDFLEYEVRIAEDEEAPLVPDFKSLELRNVSFAYEGQEKNVLSDINFTINRGERIAIVGHNGAGKTTLIKLLLRLYDPAGEILLNGENIKNYRLSSYRNMFGTVFQDYQLFATSVAENVLLRGDITDTDRVKVMQSLNQAGIYEKIESFSKGVDTIVTKEFDSEGAAFSGGEAQKISIARIFAGSHEIIIMDEPTSALDPIAEQEMYRNMFEACKGKTVIFISHRLSSATMADRVYMFENGRIIEQGTHAELIALNAKYADMWHKQADVYTEEVAYG